MISRYPSNWRIISNALKESENWHCYRCGIQCYSPEDLINYQDSRQRRYLLQVHHWDFQPENNNPNNLVCVCTVCHLLLHRRQYTVLPGQFTFPWIDLQDYFQTPVRAEPRSRVDNVDRINNISVHQLSLWDLNRPVVSSGKKVGKYRWLIVPGQVILPGLDLIAG